MPAISANPRLHWYMALSLVLALALTALPLPRLFAPFRPDWIALIAIYWALFASNHTGVILIFTAGLMLDVLFGTLLGQHAMALVIMSYFPLRFHLRIRVFSWVQLTAAVFGLLTAYRFILFWINGITGLTPIAVDYWGPVVTGTLLWPVIMLLMDGLHSQRSASN